MEKFDIDDIDLACWIMRRDWQGITQNLRERTDPLSVKYCKKIADLIDPDKLQPQGRPPLNKRLGEVAYSTKQWPKNITKMVFIRTDARYRALIGKCHEVAKALGHSEFFREHPELIITNAGDAIERTCETFGIGTSTCKKIHTQCKRHPLYAMEKQFIKEVINNQK